MGIKRRKQGGKDLKSQERMQTTICKTYYVWGAQGSGGTCIHQSTGTKASHYRD